MAIVGFILAFFMPLIGLILSIIALTQIKKTGEGGKGLAVAGIIISVIMMILGMLLVIGWFALIAASMPVSM